MDQQDFVIAYKEAGISKRWKVEMQFCLVGRTSHLQTPLLILQHKVRFWYSRGLKSTNDRIAVRLVDRRWPKSIHLASHRHCNLFTTTFTGPM